jgi:hypothetical protein
MMAQYLLKYVESPVFIVESSYDSWSIQNILIMFCANSRTLLECDSQEKAFIEGYAN